ncbi:P-loop containing nucleoside triphosphate hydrolase protein [Coemansia reversa NRRL 1564]|uniref:P-loop containing nucleoside triphosphate hydrolase protein n=1 Tax=Coemansia reversa (strain ATCC 12441 / NRRL 1564) TaxID=763665 RepID=A0A2G5B0K4_COERN|nr:P-loop containing nucleoside triphosphate hydrolase protein [Coemansia reversa NRRL 1564]|eukprot:PIA12540.1 P-loop containing nucleoside triphosphate hydrolase protein [Coemansia reversa NRRL 1564]
MAQSGDATNAPSMDAIPILKWSNLNYDVKVKGGTRRILHNISGSIYPGELVAIMGSSGAGKTTLLNVLAGRVQGGRLEGEIKFLGATRNPHTFKRMLAYVEQDDLMHSALTVKETLLTSAQLRLSNNVYSPEDKQERVSTVMRQLRLLHIKDSRIGGGGKRGVSGGERKRVSIGAELVIDPGILVLDEPSSGLDSSSAEMVIELTKEMSRQRNLCTLVTIHQPSAEMVARFDKVILLAQGKLVYMGPTTQAVPHFEKLGYPPTHSNPANFFIDLMTIDFSSTEATLKSEERVQLLVDAFAEFQQRGGNLQLPTRKSFEEASIHSSEDCVPAQGQENNASSSTSIAALNDACSGKGSQAGNVETNLAHCGLNAGDITQEEANLFQSEPPPMNSWVSEAWILLKRDWILTIRNRSFVNGLIVQAVVMMLFNGFVFFQLDNNQASVQNRIGTLFTLTLVSTFPVAIPLMTVIMSGRDVLHRERSGGMYRMTTYFVARALSFYPVVYIPYIIMFAGIYFIANLQYDVAKFFISLLVYAVLLFCSLGFAFLMAMIVRQMDVAHTITPVCLSVFMLFAGNLSNANAITPVLRWIKYVCIFYYSYSGLVQNEFNGLEFDCSTNESSCYSSGEDVIDAYGLDEIPIWGCVVINFALGLGFYIIAYLSLRWVAKPRFLWL